MATATKKVIKATSGVKVLRKNEFDATYSAAQIRLIHNLQAALKPTKK